MLLVLIIELLYLTTFRLVKFLMFQPNINKKMKNPSLITTEFSLVTP